MPQTSQTSRGLLRGGDSGTICKGPHRYAPLQFKIIPGRKSVMAKGQSVAPNTFNTYKLV